MCFIPCTKALLLVFLVSCSSFFIKTMPVTKPGKGIFVVLCYFLGTYLIWTCLELNSKDLATEEVVEIIYTYPFLGVLFSLQVLTLYTCVIILMV
jgi:hypothetical protein